MKFAKKLSSLCTELSCRAVIKLGSLGGVRARRLYFISSVFAAAMKEVNWWRSNSEAIQARLQEINEATKLADSVDSLEFPMMMHGIVWKEEAQKLWCEEALRAALEGNMAELHEYCEKIVKATPKFLRYGRFNEVTQDIKEQLLKYASAHAVQA